MRKIIFAALAILMFSIFAHAELAALKMEERVKANNLIVIGTLRDVSESETDTLKISKGALVIEQIIFGNFKTSDGHNLKIDERVQLEWTNSKWFACQFGFPENLKGIWFLNVNEKGDIESLSPSSSTALTDLAEVKTYFRKKDKNQAVRILNTLKNNEKAAQLNSAAPKSEEPVRCLYSTKTKQKEYFPFAAFLVILAFSSLYYFLYRSRFKIR